ncbi:MAG: hypothetical protein WA902_10965, partial [Thermosynechococcaceae cyanobacterium]
IERENFLQALSQAGRSEFAFPEKYIQVYLRVEEWVSQRINITLHCNQDSSDLKPCQLLLLGHLSLTGDIASDVQKCLSRRKFLAYLVPVARKRSNSHWEVSKKLRLSPLFGLYRLADGSEQAYACAFNQDALLLEALKWQLRKFCQVQPQSLIF